MNKDVSSHDSSTFYDENGKVLHHIHVERQKQLDAYVFTPSDSVVLELGAHNGIVSCLLNRGLKNPENHVVITDSQYTNTLIKNRDNNGCKFTVLSEPGLNVTKIAELEYKYSLRFDVIVAECERSISSLIQDDNLSKVKIILLEREPLCQCDHQQVESYLTKLGFVCMRNVSGTIYRAVYFNMNFLPFNIISHYVADGNIGLFGRLGYISEIADVITDGSELCSVSLHAPSHLYIESKRDLIVRGYASPTAKGCPILSFKVDDQVIGEVSNPGGKTDGYRVSPGKHFFGVHPNTVSWAHSVWLFEDPKIVPQSDRKYFRIDIARTGSGLVNQLINLVNGITFSNSVERHIYNPHFLPNYNSTEWIPLSTVFDIDHLNKMFASMNLNVRIVTDESIGKKDWIKSKTYNNICSTNSRLEITKKLLEDDHPFLDLGSVFSVTVEKDEFVSKIEREFYKNMRFTSGFHAALNYIQDNFLCEKYHVVHLRLEDDFISPYSGHFGHSYKDYTMIILNRYFEFMAKMFSPHDKIYIATHLLKAQYPNNYVIDLIREKYPNIVTSVPWREHITLPSGREIDAIVDYLICANAQKFIGMHGSTFSILLGQFHDSKGHEAGLVDLHA